MVFPVYNNYNNNPYIEKYKDNVKPVPKSGEVKDNPYAKPNWEKAKKYSSGKKAAETGFKDTLTISAEARKLYEQSKQR
ncbi:MAG: hypothetical protein BWY78_00934 [Alphaproteobacteria bacterium ADurb.Bin438]|nr:MAG: hypothetical protein BWY78_00934 [Alphaproteobacteria bacterium ADurb.Bin438]